MVFYIKNFVHLTIKENSENYFKKYTNLKFYSDSNPKIVFNFIEYFFIYKHK